MVAARAYTSFSLLKKAAKYWVHSDTAKKVSSVVSEIKIGFLYVPSSYEVKVASTLSASSSACSFVSRPHAHGEPVAAEQLCSGVEFVIVPSAHVQFLQSLS